MQVVENHRNGGAPIYGIGSGAVRDRSPGRWLSLLGAVLIVSVAALLPGCAKTPKRVALAGGTPPPRLLQVGLMLDSPAPGSVQVASPKAQGKTNELLSVRLVPGLDESGLGTDHQICAFGLRLGVQVQFKGKAVQQLSNLTRTNIGRHMVVISEGEVVSTPKIVREIRDGALFLPGDWTFDEAMAFCKRLNPTGGSK